MHAYVQCTVLICGPYYQVMRLKNSYFQPKPFLASDCTTTAGNTGAVTLLLTEPKNVREFGHLAMVLHEDTKLELPEDLNNDHYVSFSNFGNTIGAIITGTRATYVGFGQDLGNVTQTKTLYNANIPSMLIKWEEVKKSGLMFDLLQHNCAHTALEILSAGYPGCQMELKQLWTPKQAFEIVSTQVFTTSQGMHYE